MEDLTALIDASIAEEKALEGPIEEWWNEFNDSGYESGAYHDVTWKELDEGERGYIRLMMHRFARKVSK